MSSISLISELDDMQRHFFELILQHTTESAKEVREMVLNDKSLLAIKYRPLNDAGEQSIHYPLHLELEAYKFLGAYIGSVTAVQLCLLVGDVELAKDLIDRTVAKESLDIQCGGGNTALHLAAFFNYPTVCKTLIDAGADSSIKNAKGFRALDLVEDVDTRQLFAKL